MEIEVRETYPCMGTQVEHRVFGTRAEEALAAVHGESVRLERLLSRFREESDVCRLNRLAGIAYAGVSGETCRVLERAREFSVLSGGRFDVTVGPLSDLWDWRHAIQPPSKEDIRRVLPLVDYRGLKANTKDNTARLAGAGQAVDLGGIGKGYAGDCFMRLFREYGVASAFSNIGGNVCTLGVKPDGLPWRVGIRHPRSDGLIGAVTVAGESVVTSGDYERYFTDREGRRFHHILSPQTGRPATAGLVSVTVIAESAMDADALSTAIFVAGKARGLHLLKKYRRAQAVLIDSGLHVYATRGLRGRFKVTAGTAVRYVRI